jgi:Ni,Fe-hydrogenase I small subunit
VLCVEGAMLRGRNGTGRFHVLAGTGVPMIDWVARLASVAHYTVAIGTCAAYGGITAAGANPADACGLQYDGDQPGGLLGAAYRSRSGPVVNVAGCPTHPDWVVETLSALSMSLLDPAALDTLGRPRFYADQLVHHGCTRNEFYEYKASAVRPSDLGCMMEHLGCKGTQAHADCNTRCGTATARARAAAMRASTARSRASRSPATRSTARRTSPASRSACRATCRRRGSSRSRRCRRPRRRSAARNATADHLKVAPAVRSRPRNK